MFHYISGTLAAIEPTFAVIDAGGVGYKLTVTQTTFGTLSHKASTESNARARLYTYLAVREDGIELFGFASEEELDAFKLLITVSGVGPKAAISILSQLTPAKLHLAICNDDKKAIAQANGIGPKTAARIILELKDKIAKSVDFLGDSSASDLHLESIPQKSSKLNDAADALMALGYTRNEAHSVLRAIDTEKLELDDIIRLALKKIMK
ncbi:MAG: Holliday junction branch migration protein RuvA [Clostridia bacterium]|nr:Holliday junction branch migration protein RuvA [Clostridia bacterium]